MTEPPAGITMTRVFDAPRERVWLEWTEPERFADWFGGPEAEVDVASMDVRPGGRWRATMWFGPARRESHWRGEYLEVVAPERLVVTITDQPEEVYELLVVELADLGDGRTEMRFEQRGWRPPEQYERTEKGWSGFFDRMAERLATG
jgi:uncharacterized protein YndB with AHSA1/START domain